MSASCGCGCSGLNLVYACSGAADKNIVSDGCAVLCRKKLRLIF